MNTLEVALARLGRRAAWLAQVAVIDAEEAPKKRQRRPVAPRLGRPGRKRTHGHPAAYWRHVHDGETPCPPCVAAYEVHKAKNRDNSRRRREQKRKERPNG